MQTLDETIDLIDNERIEIVLDPEQSLTPQDEDTAWDQDKLAHLIKSLMTIIDSMDRVPSFFSKAAIFWASIPWWLQLIALVVLVVPPLVLGIVFTIPALIVLSASIFILYCGFSFLFYNHNQYQASNTDLIKEQIINLANGLDLELQQLQEQTKQIVRETTIFCSANNELAQKIDTLETQLNQLTQQSTRLNKTKHDLYADNDALGNRVERRNEANQEHAEQLQVYQQMMRQLKLDHKENSSKWSETICELNQIIIELDSELTQQKQISQTFKTSVEQMKGIVFTEEKDQIIFQEKLEGLFSKKIDIAQELRQRIEQANRERLILEEAIARCNQQFERLLKREEVTLTRMEADYGVSSVGFFATDDKTECSEESKTDFLSNQSPFCKSTSL
jgi:hypothetical protein